MLFPKKARDSKFQTLAFLPQSKKKIYSKLNLSLWEINTVCGGGWFQILDPNKVRDSKLRTVAFLPWSKNIKPIKNDAFLWKEL